jgi:hypothetical protein
MADDMKFAFADARIAAHVAGRFVRDLSIVRPSRCRRNQQRRRDPANVPDFMPLSRQDFAKSN